MRHGPTEPAVLSRAQTESLIGTANVTSCLTENSRLFRVLKITTWSSLVWIGIGFIGQFIFAGRMVLQWLTSERHRRSVVTESFWWFSLLGGVILFCYFVWRQDVVPILGQASGIVVYIRNIRLYKKHARRAARQQALMNEGSGTAAPPIT
jgi:lipid-A-disaccharide synthase-like uncharacterized protein